MLTLQKALFPLVVALLPLRAHAQFPSTPTGLTVVQSKFHPNVTISYKQNDLCETTDGVKSFSGYVHLPAGELADTGTVQDYPINLFFWFFESRKDPANAPTSFWMNGGPGSSSMLGLLQENGPCFVNDDSSSTYLNPWSWNNEVNMIYLDQPVQTGFSYDVATNGTLNATIAGTEVDYSGSFTTESTSKDNYTTIAGTFASGNQASTANTTVIAAHAAWHFAQTFFGEFPEYQPNDNKISIWTESYGGRYGPGFTSFFEHQNARIESGELRESGAIDLHMDTLGIINGCVDILIQEASYPRAAWNNTYGIKAISEEQYNSAVDAFYKPGGGKEQIEACYQASAKLDPNQEADVDSVNAICVNASNYINNYVEGVFLTNNTRGYYDMGHLANDPFPPPYYLGYLMQADVQQALGVPVNYSDYSSAVGDAFTATGDYALGGFMEDLTYILSRGVKVTMMYGDRDYACNWYGGQDVSEAIEWKHKADFNAAGYTPLIVNSSYIGGQTRQYGNLSFTRIYESGHEVPAYQPEAAFRVFTRALTNKDIATGDVDILSNTTYHTSGLSNIDNIMNDVPPLPEQFCYVLNPASCDNDTWNSVVNGTAYVKDYIVQTGNANSSTTSNGTSSTAGLPTPTQKSAANKLITHQVLLILVSALFVVVHATY